MSMSTIGFFLFKATTLFERAETFYVSVTELLCTSNFLIQFCKMGKIFELIEKYEEFIEKSKKLYIFFEFL